MSLLVPGMLFVVWAFPESRRQNIWLVSFAIAVLGLVGVIAIDLFGFLADGGEPSQVFVRALFAAITATEMPFVAMAIGSILNGFVSHGKDTQD